VDVAAECVDPVGDALQAGALPRGSGVESLAVVGDFELELGVAFGQANAGAGGVCVFRGVVQGLQRAEVHGRLGFLRVAPDPARLDGNGDRGLARLGVQGSGDAHVGQQRLADATGELPEVLQRLCGVRCHLVQQRFRLNLVVLQRLGRQLELAGQAGQLPLRAVADVAFQPLAFPVLGGDQALT
jgi:hypothetical protein